MKKTIFAAAALSLMAVGPVQADQALATQSGCMACHQIDAKVVGPGYKEVAAKYKGQEGAVDLLTQKVIEGGVGNWGQVPMPPKGGRADVSDEDIRKVVEWILTL
jgi:cytochrome c